MILSGLPASSTPSWPKYKNIMSCFRLCRKGNNHGKKAIKSFSHVFSMLHLNCLSIFRESQLLSRTVHTKLAKILKLTKILKFVYFQMT